MTGPLPADTLFSRARGGEFDIVVAMYHDQGHIPVKTLGFEYDEATKKWTGLSGVNVTVGLPFLRVSVDHGTAFDRAWKGMANHESMVEALDVATRMVASTVRSARSAGGRAGRRSSVVLLSAGQECPMDEQEIRSLIDDVKTGRLSRRRFVQTMVGPGAHRADGGADARPPPAWPPSPRRPVFTPTRRGGGGPLRVLWWQAPTLLNPHFATGTKDQDGSRIFYEPLAGVRPRRQPGPRPRRRHPHRGQRRARP